ncbi:hypothetical protein COU62_02170 [Candidatus Pacearchaeota archaeon CG10_big_fil_rev_8_21_14_0_10_35_219]|nr:toprim domain-containing protein [Candidatus Pacearchaeota archaeon]OIO41950.1 MAG: hypothetical protein AUJ63_04315 [Candidatus Pacearchaeota archaeon CG1_02_35_32]PIO07775.1 MAG: hypothetical protein COU62_02170 [Candidatus Pacearchaeota archaeon CG10_big_fil_rev_8_21_14_0_10_35_219]PIY80997.1 MAG: hypothetical protein COY79_04280 [Candidatus Pacearchaeota archaeon CG_4_10_14_0_8_um_filter_35_169]PJA70297.1 MAG: hypothetical protein CO155_01500 [Candidatus Pacearchaeota archaeon CG_4_9_14_
MKFNPKLKLELEKYKDYVILVEGKKDVLSLAKLGFQRVYAVHVTGIPIRERLEKIAEELGKKDRVCILTDFDKKGKKLYMFVKGICQELGMKLDSRLRGILIKAGVSHVEGLDSFMEKVGNIG